jgi:eukaryotic-like serine/threonine-protein kinase
MVLDMLTVPGAVTAEAAVAAFEHTFEEAGSADLEDFLPPAPDPDYPAVLCELVRADLRLNWAAGRRRYVDDYVRRFPVELAEPSRLAALAQEEYQARVAAGDDVEAEAYQSRYGVQVDGWLRPVPTPRTPHPADLISLPRERTRTVALPRARSASVPPAARSAPARKPSNPGQMPKPGQRFLHFDLVRELGRGVFGRVFLARQADLAERLVALKVTPELDGEPQLLARLQHTNIVPIHAVYQAGALQAICMPYFGSVTLARVIADLGRRPGQLPQTGRGLLSTLFETRLDGAAPTHTDVATSDPPSEEPPALTALAQMSQVDAALWIAARLADGLAHAHDRGILHCDLKPANVLIADDGQPMLLDFNVAADRKSLAAQKSLRLGGTLPYMAPEYLNLVHNDTGELTPRSDLFSLGIVLYELLTGTDPYPAPADEAQNPVAAYLALHSKLPEPPSRKNPAVTPAVDAIVKKLLEPDPGRRYADAAQVREDLDRQLSNRPLLHAKDPSVRERARKWRRRNPRLTAGLAVALAAIVFLILPATAVAIRSEQLAARRHEVARAEAVLAHQEAVRELKTAQILLTTRTLDPALVKEGFDRGQAVLDRYGIETDSHWADRSRVTLLSADQQQTLRHELGGMLLMLARVELARKPAGAAEAAEAALKWNRLAEQCYPADARPRLLARQRAALLKVVPGQAELLAEPPAVPLDDYFDALDAATAGDPNKALAKVVSFTDNRPDHFMAWYLRGQCHEAVAQYTDAAAAFTVCVNLWPDFPMAHFNRGLMRLRQGRPADAEGDFTRALDRKPNWTEALFNRAIARQHQGNYKGAEADLTAVLARPDGPTRAYFFRAKVRELLGDKDGAAADLTEGKKLEPRDVLSWIVRGTSRYKTDPAGAVADYEAALAVHPRSADALQSKAAVLADQLNRPNDAVDALDRLLELYPHHTEGRAARAVYAARTGDAKRVLPDIDRVLKEEPTSYRHFQMAGAYAQLSKADPTGKYRQQALVELSKAFRGGFERFDKVANDKDLDPVRTEAEFKDLVEHAKKLHVVQK